MKVKVRVSGMIQSACGWSEKEFALSDGSTIQELKDFIESSESELRFESFRASAAINKVMADDESKLSDGDEVVFLPPLAGG